MKIVPFYLILGALSIFTACKNPNRTDGSSGSFDSIVSSGSAENSVPLYLSETSEYGDVSYFNVTGDSLLLVNGRMLTENLPMSRIKISDYIGKMKFDSKASVLRLPSGDEYLFIHYYSGGAHCCSVIEAYIYNQKLRAFEMLDSYTYDGDLVELVHPFDISNWVEYFYCSYAAGQDFDCYASDYSQKLYFEGNRFLFKATGSKEILVSCYLNYLQTTNIPELNEGNDLGEREKIANFFIKYYSLDQSLENVFSLFNSYFPPRKDKAQLWEDIANLLIPQDERTSDVTMKISGFKERLTIVAQNRPSVQFRAPVQFYGRSSQDLDLDDLSCDELTELVERQGSLSDDLSSSEMDSDMLESVELYEYESNYYVIADFQRGGTYIYCDVSWSAWSNFKDNDYDSYGKSFHAYIANDFICNCQ